MDFIHVSFVDVIDIVGFALIMYHLNRLTRGTNAPNILVGILIIYGLWLVVNALSMEMLSAILGNIVGGGVIALIVVFQPEIRRFLHIIGTSGKMGQKSIWSRIFDLGNENVDDSESTIINPLVDACKNMSDSRTGALIVIQRRSDLSTYVETGVVVDSQVSAPLIQNIFFRNSPLHDGAMIISNKRIAAAKCTLPSTKSEVPLSFGMRHRAAIGMSEESDAIVVVVSEETGAVSIATEGNIKKGLNIYELRSELMAEIDDWRR